MIKLTPGSALDNDGAYAIRRGGDTQVIALLGAIGSGKTTLIAGLLQAFLSGPVAGYRFKRSDTLPAFEERCYDSRVTSGASAASTVRTSSLSGQHYYHLEVVLTGQSSSKRLLLLDMSGEFYEAALSSNEEAGLLKSLTGVNRVVHLLDGGNLSNPSQREKVYSVTRQLMRRLYETGTLEQSIPLQMVVSKLDQFAKASDPESVQAAMRAVEGRFEKDRARRTWEFFGVASSPAVDKSFALRFGLPELFGSWLNEPEQVQLPTPPIRVKTGPLSILGPAWAPERYVRG